ncbi:stage IV sporulation protein B [Desulfohalotomaculum tongense]|uniref:SpoIVB peptidase n=1 Tax=Desulforadius tongensis TaxID=1216062 RepID=UPI00195AE101|nr:SpoIVB peptidase [Desulforadius tongensis]MBM7855506.1 stage IV sporulation protein B [Desulforadius tongensis]
MDRDKKIKLLSLIFILALALLCLNTQVMHLCTLPMQKKIMVGEALDLGFERTNEFLRALQVDIEAEKADCVEGLTLNNSTFTLAGAAPVATTPGKINMYLKLFGIIPLRNVTVDVVPEVKVLPGGQSIGVMLHSQGVIVVGLAAVENSRGKSYNPAREAGIKVGDILLKINDQSIETENQVRDMVTKAGHKGEAVILEIKRQNKKFTVKVKPAYCKETKDYRLGLLIRDSAAGVGTLTFYDQVSSIYGALGHVITDSDTGQKIDLSNGRIFEASIQDIHPGKTGQPGEKIGLLENDSKLCGNIKKNTPYGIFGELSYPITNPYFKNPIPVALPSQIKEGPAEIITVLHGNRMERFKIKIEKVTRQSRPDGKGMIIKITDPKLLQKTGGIIQGMSGSPIIQYTENGNPVLVGAVTHVFINDPTRGYAVLAEWMLEETKTLLKETGKNLSNLHAA